MAKRVLIVDDEPDVVTYLSMVLEQYGFEPIAAKSADEALEFAQKNPPDIICLDIMMPKRSGFSFYAAIHEDAKLAAIPVVVISGVVQAGEFDFRQFVPDEKVEPPEHYLEKPIDVEQFIGLLRRLTAGKTARRSSKGGR